VQQVELARRQLQRAAVHARLPAARVDPQPADHDLGVVRVVPAATAAQHGADARVELRRAERLDHVVVGARVEHGDDLGLVVAGRGDDDRDPADPPQHPQHRGAVDVGQPEVEDDDVRTTADGVLEAGQPGRRGRDGVAALGQPAHERGADRRVVLDDQDLGHAADDRARRRAHVAS
jgi:hypothetical protein